MLTNNDVGEFFKKMHSNYGPRWRYTPQDIPHWRGQLSKFDADQLVSLATTCTGPYPDWPPNVGQCKRLLEPQKAPNTYTLAPDVPREKAVANRALLKTLLDCGGVDSIQLKKLVTLRDAVIEDNGDRGICEEFVDELLHEFRECAARSDPELRRQEISVAIEKFRVRQGMTARRHGL